jgi:hypothetical protein
MKLLAAASGICALVLSALSAPIAPVAAQGTQDTTKSLRVFVDCGYCDLDFIRTEMPWVDYMRDRADAQVHILVTQEGTGGGGSQYTLNFIGLKEFAARNDTLHYTASVDDTQDAIRRGLTRMIHIGILPFIAGTPTGQRVRVSLAGNGPSGPAGTGAARPGASRDPWNFWTFRLGVNGYGQGQTQSKNANYNGSVSASRITEDWKISLSANKSENDQSFTIPDTDSTEHTSKFVSKSGSLSELIVRSLGGNFSAGLQSSLSTSTFGNTSRSFSVQPAVEYDFFPYKESNRRMLTLKYAIGIRSFEYRDTTIYFKTEETHPQHSLDLAYNTQERWGSVYISGSYSQYLHDRSFYNAGVFASADVRLFKGFSFNVGGDYSRVHDQLGLRKGTASVEEILLRQRELKTDYSYFLSAGISYRFGSIFNNVVNPRFGGGGGGTIMIMN